MTLCPIALTKELIEMPSITPNDGGSLAYLAEILRQHHFDVEMINKDDTKNLWACAGDITKPLIIFLGHVDVVPPGPETAWKFPPFKATEFEGYLYGRGAADMKSGVAAAVTAAIGFLSYLDRAPFRLGILLTSDEEGSATYGVKHVMEVFKARGEKITYCIVSEPSAKQQVGDVIKIGRRGSVSGKLKILGKQGHIAYPELADNPIHCFAPVLQQLTDLKFDAGNDYFQPTQIQFSNIHAGVGADNVIPGYLEADFNLRYSPIINAEEIQTSIEKILNEAKVKYEIKWRISGLPFLTSQGKLIDCALTAIHEVTSLTPIQSTNGGTSDGRYVAPTGAEVVEIGLCNATIHQIDECIKISDIKILEGIYIKTLTTLAQQINSK